MPLPWLLVAACMQAPTLPPATAITHRPKASVSRQTAVSTTVPDLPLPTSEATARAFVDNLCLGRFLDAAAQLDANMARALPPTQLEQVWSPIQQRVGALREVESFDATHRAGRNHVWLRVSFEHAPWLFEVVVDSRNQVSGLSLFPEPPQWTPPSYADASRIQESNLELGRAPALAGVLTSPTGSVDAVAVLVHGSGPQDADATSGPRGTGNKIFKDLAWGLASRGVAVVRYPKRIWAQAEAFEDKAYNLDDEFTQDACAALQVAVDRLKVPAQRVFVVAHSLGATMTPRIAKACPTMGGLVLLAGPTRPYDHLLVDQFEYLIGLAGKSRDDAAQELQELMAGLIGATIPSIQGEQDIGVAGMHAPRSYWNDLLGYDPAKAFQAAPSLPMLVMQGMRDYQVTMTDFLGWKRILRGRPGVSFRSFPSLDHQFVPGEGISTPADYRRSGHVSVEVIDQIASWIQAIDRPRAIRTIAGQRK